MGPAPQRQRAIRADSFDRYTLPNGLVLPSVTAILDATMPADKVKALDMWRRRVGEAEANRKRDAGAARGAALHASIRRKLRGLPTFGGVWLKSVDRILGQVTRPLEIGDYGSNANPDLPIPVWNEADGYAGTPDLVCEIDAGELLGEARSRPSIAVLDWTSWDTTPAKAGAPRRKYRAEYCFDKHVQVAAYAKACAWSHNVDVDAGFVVIALPDAPAIVYPVDIEACWREFLERLERFDASRQPELAPVPDLDEVVA